MSFDPVSTWFGVGVKTGCSFGPGYEQFDGVIWNCNDFRYAGLRVQNIRIGLGLGCTTGISMALAFNAAHQSRLHNLELSDWGVNIAIGNRLGSIISAVRNPQAWASLVRMLRAYNRSRVGPRLYSAGIRAISPHDLDNIRNLVSTGWTARDVSSAHNSNQPQVILLDIPFAGLGAEISINHLTGHAEIYY